MADHIQLHQGWMRNFRNDVKDGEQVYCFNIGDVNIEDGQHIIAPGTIGSIKIKTLGALPDYYVDDFEHYLDKNWESKFGELNQYLLDEFKKSNNKIYLSNKQIDFIKRFMAVNSGRSKFMHEFIKNKAESYYEIFGNREIVPLSIVAENLKLFEDKNIQFLRNKTNIGFVLPSMSYYYVETQYEGTPIIVINDKLAIRFINKYPEPYNSQVKGLVLDINDEENIKNYNYSALIVEMYTNNQFIIAKHKEELECLLNRK